MLDDFFKKIVENNASTFNENEDILRRMKIISEMYNHASGRSTKGSRPAVDISIVIPVYYSKDIIESTVLEIQSVLHGMFYYEIILVNDGSTDGSSDVIRKLAHNSPNIRSINLMKNFGQHNAIMAGLHEASGDHIVFMDDDGQHDPAYIPQMIEKIKQGYDVVYVKYDQKEYGRLKNLGSKINDIMSTWLLDKPADLYLSSFKALTRKIKDQILRYPGPYPYIDGAIFTSTRNVVSIPAKHRGTDKTSSTYSLKKLMEHWLNMFTNFSVKPLRAIFFLGFFTGIGSFALFLVLSVIKIINPSLSPPGWTMIAALILFFGALQLVCLGLVGEYIGRILLFINKRPQFVIRDKVGRDE
jgi:glycosyltransferase involved in cell wall biosynthesis